MIEKFTTTITVDTLLRYAKELKETLESVFTSTFWGEDRYFFLSEFPVEAIEFEVRAWPDGPNTGLDHRRLYVGILYEEDEKRGNKPLGMVIGPPHVKWKFSPSRWTYMFEDHFYQTLYTAIEIWKANIIHRKQPPSAYDKNEVIRRKRKGRGRKKKFVRGIGVPDVELAPLLPDGAVG